VEARHVKQVVLESEQVSQGLSQAAQFSETSQEAATTKTIKKMKR
jgi:hypothetical protein